MKVKVKTYGSEKKARKAVQHLARTTKHTLAQFGKKVVVFK